MESVLFVAQMLSFALAVGMTGMAWTIVRQNRRREAARIVLLSNLAFPAGRPADVHDVAAGDDRTFHVDEFRREPMPAPDTLFAEPEPSGSASRRTVALAAVAASLLIVVVASRWLGAGGGAAAHSPADQRTAAMPAAPAVKAAEPHVELLSLQYRTTPTGFHVTGHVRNPGGLPLHDVVAVVHLLDSAGRVLTTVLTPVRGDVLNAGELAAFSAVASNATNVARYRVGFRARGQDVVRHIDLRERTSS
jgi:hypothetical protein